MRRRLLQSRRRKSQSAMEYLMTYGWAILIIAIVLAALFQLGVFSSASFAPKAPPGSCQVFRPNGPGTTSFISTEGECNGELPQYVAQFNGQDGDITAPLPTTEVVNTTISTWIFASANPVSNNNIFLMGNNGGTNGYGVFVACANNNLAILESSVRWICTGVTFNSLEWQNLVLKSSGYNGNVIYEIYLNGAKVYNSGQETLPPTPIPPMYIGHDPANGGYFPGYISNFQIYNTSLSGNEIQAIYQEGIGGAPIDLQNLVAWWPLNGNSNDYSGNNNNGVPNGVTYTSNWFSGYAAP